MPQNFVIQHRPTSTSTNSSVSYKKNVAKFCLIPASVVRRVLWTMWKIQHNSRFGDISHSFKPM